MPIFEQPWQRLTRRLKKCREAKLRTRYLIIINLDAGRSPTQTAAVLHVSRTTIYRVAERYRGFGEAGLIDRREENGEQKLTTDYLAALREVVRSVPEKYGWKRPTWTREMLVETLQKLTGIRIHVATMSVALKTIRARRGRPKPIVNCPWTKRAKNRRLRDIQALIDQLPVDEVVVFEDEVDIHLNPKIGLDWMLCGQQKQVSTPGKNEKRYLAGAKNVQTGELIWVEAEKKDSLLFLYLLWELVQHYRTAKVIHVILDNYGIHKTRQVEVSLQTEAGQKLRLHFLPPYCPDHNQIERTWEDLHANVTRNHRRETLQELIKDVRHWLKKRNRDQQQKTRSCKMTTVP